jgi:hypothetical protein
MRRDMAKVVVDCVRLNRDAEKNVGKGRKLRFDDMPYYEGMKAGRRRGWHRKKLCDRLNPLRRYLERQVGRPWNEVFSEICETINPDSTIQQHIRGHIFDIVAIHTYRGDDGEINFAKGTRQAFSELYVDPDDGVLRVPEPWRYRDPPKRPEVFIFINCERAYQRLNGIWFEVFYTDLPDSIVVEDIDEQTGERCYRRVAPTLADMTNYKWLTPSIYSNLDRYAHAKRQLTTRELRKAGLVNC